MWELLALPPRNLHERQEAERQRSETARLVVLPRPIVVLALFLRDSQHVAFSLLQLFAHIVLSRLDLGSLGFLHHFFIRIVCNAAVVADRLL